jgi:hypothetical protein
LELAPSRISLHKISLTSISMRGQPRAGESRAIMHWSAQASLISSGECALAWLIRRQIAFVSSH